MRLNVKDFGAVGDGVTNCRDAVRAAIAAAAGLRSAEIYFPRGHYHIDLSGEEMTQGEGQGPAIRIVGCPQMTVVGESRGGTILSFDRQGGNLANWSGLLFKAGTRGTLADLTIRGPAVPRTPCYPPGEESHAVATEGGLVLDDVTIDGRGFYQFMNAVGGGLVEFRHCDVSSWGSGMSGPGNHGRIHAYDSHFRGPSVELTDQRGVTIYPNPDISLLFERCRFSHGSAGYSVHHFGTPRGAEYVTFRECVWEETCHHGVIVTGPVQALFEDCEFYNDNRLGSTDCRAIVLNGGASALVRRTLFCNRGWCVAAIFQSDGGAVLVEDCHHATPGPYACYEPRGPTSQWTFRRASFAGPEQTYAILSNVDPVAFSVEDCHIDNAKPGAALVYANRGRVHLAGNTTSSGAAESKLEGTAIIEGADIAAGATTT